jgi:hypothetical protein
MNIINFNNNIVTPCQRGSRRGFLPSSLSLPYNYNPSNFATPSLSTEREPEGEVGRD